MTLGADQMDVPSYLQENYGGVDFAFEAIGRVSTIESLPVCSAASRSAYQHCCPIRRKPLPRGFLHYWLSGWWPTEAAISS